MPGLFPGVEHGIIPAKTKTDPFEPRRKLSGRSGAAIERKPSLNKAFPLGEHFVRLEAKDLSEWPVEIFTKTLLKTLVLSKNRLTAVCPGIESLRALRRLELGGNRITAVSPEICKLSHLEHLGLENNCIEQLPIEAGYMVQIQTVNLEGNPLSGKACETAVETFHDVWHQPAAAATGPPRGNGGGLLAEKTRGLLRYLQDSMTSAERGVLTDREQRWRRRQARQALKSAVKVADMMRLQKALNTAEAAGLSVEDMSEGRVALLVLQTLRKATDRRSSEDMMAAISSWEKVSNLGEGNCRNLGGGADLDRALELLKDIKRETLALSFRRRSEGLLGSGRRAAAAAAAAAAAEEEVEEKAQDPPKHQQKQHQQPPAAEPKRLPQPAPSPQQSSAQIIPSIQSSPSPQKDAEGGRVVTRRLTPVPRMRTKPAKAGGGQQEDITYEQWLRNKNLAQRRKREEMREYNKQLRLQRLQKEEREREEQERLEKLEKLWPSRADEGHIPIGLESDDRQNPKGPPLLGEDSEQGFAQVSCLSLETSMLHPVLEEADEEGEEGEEGVGQRRPGIAVDKELEAARAAHKRRAQQWGGRGEDGTGRPQELEEGVEQDQEEEDYDQDEFEEEVDAGDARHVAPGRVQGRIGGLFVGEPPISSRLMQARNLLMTEPPSPRLVDDEHDEFIDSD